MYIWGEENVAVLEDSFPFEFTWKQIVGIIINTQFTIQKRL